MKKMILGLCNYGNEFNCTRHNAGEITTIYFKNEIYLENDNYILFFSHIKNTFVLQIKNYINLSGYFLQKFLYEYSYLNIEHIYVFIDDVNIKIANIKIQRQFCKSNHNGVINLRKYFDFKNPVITFIRIGVNPCIERKISPLKDFVLSKMDDEEIKELHNLSKTMMLYWSYLEKEQDSVFMQNIKKSKIFNA